MRAEQEAVYKQTKKTNQEIKPFEYVNIFTDNYTQKPTKKRLILNHRHNFFRKKNEVECRKSKFTQEKKTKTYFT